MRMSFKKGDEWIEADSENGAPIRATVMVEEKKKKEEAKSGEGKEPPKPGG